MNAFVTVMFFQDPAPEPVVTITQLKDKGENKWVKMTIGSDVYYRIEYKSGGYGWRDEDFDRYAFGGPGLEESYLKATIADLNSDTEH